ncbi:MAG: 50S ribosomal protein L22 [Bacteroidaceae bacterium]|nr:50S ribosomal protein L22 [Bacteroidaceae bacterium]
MGARKRLAAKERKEALKTQYFASLQNVPSSPRKMRYVVDLIRGLEVGRALATLRFSQKAASVPLEKLLRSAVANWEQKNDRKAEEGELYVTKAFVDEGVTLKRMRPAPQGRGYRIRKRSNHVTLHVGSLND